jgi:hypothetical protein
MFGSLINSLYRREPRAHGRHAVLPDKLTASRR